MNLHSKNVLIPVLIITIIVDVMGAGLVFSVPSLFFDNACDFWRSWWEFSKLVLLYSSCMLAIRSAYRLSNHW